MANEIIDETLTGAIEKAVETHKQDLSDVVVEKEEGKEPEKKKEPEPVQDLDAEQGRVLIQALRDPQKAPIVIDFLAQQAGYTKASIQTKQDVRDAKDTINEILERNLGDDFKFLAPKLAPAIKESLETMLSSSSEDSDLRQRVEAQELKGIQTETAQTHIELAQEWFGSDDMPVEVVNAMSAAMDEFPPTATISPERYYKRIFALACGELGITKSQRQSDRVNRNMRDSSARNLASQNRGITPNREKQGSHKMSLKDSVQLALDQVDQTFRSKP